MKVKLSPTKRCVNKLMHVCILFYIYRIISFIYFYIYYYYQALQGIGNIPMETIEQHTYRSMEKRYGLRNLAVEHVGMLLQVLKDIALDTVVCDNLLLYLIIIFYPYISA